MHRTRIPSPARSDSAVTARRKTRSTRSVGSPARSNTSGRLTSIIDQFKEANRESIAPSPLNKTVLSDNTEIEKPRRQSWWKRVSSTNISEVHQVEKTMEINNIIDDLENEVLSQEKKNYSMDFSESSDSESVCSIHITKKKLLTEKENFPHDMCSQIPLSRKSVTEPSKTSVQDKTVNIGTKTLFGHGEKRLRPAFPAGLLNFSPDKTQANKTEELPTEVKAQPRNLFGHKQGTKRKNMFADFVVCESEDEISEIQPKLFAFQRNTNPVRHSTASRSSRGNREPSPVDSLTTDIEIDDWKMLPSSTMLENQLDALAASTPGKKTRLSKLSEVMESNVGTNSNTINKTKVSNNSMSKNKDKLEKTSKEQKSPINKSKANSSNIQNTSQKTVTVYEEVTDADGTSNKINNKTQVLTKTGNRSLSVIDEKSREITNTRVINNQTYKINNDTTKDLVQDSGNNTGEHNQHQKEIVDESDGETLHCPKAISSQLVSEKVQVENDKELQVEGTEVQIEVEENLQVEDGEILHVQDNEKAQLRAHNKDVEFQDDEKVNVTEDSEEEAQVEEEKDQDGKDKEVDIEDGEINVEDDAEVSVEDGEVQVEDGKIQVEGGEEMEVQYDEEVKVDDGEEVYAEDDGEINVEDGELQDEDEEEGDEEVKVDDDEEVYAEDDGEVNVEDGEVEAEDEEEVEVQGEEVEVDDGEEQVGDDKDVEAEDGEEEQVEDDEDVEIEDDDVDNDQSEMVVESEEEQEQNESEVENDEDENQDEDEDVDVDIEQDDENEDMIEESEENDQAEVQESDQEETGEIDAVQEISEAGDKTTNLTYDTTGRHRQKNVQSPEDILHNMSNQDVSFVAKARKTSISKTLLNNFTVRQSEAPLRESTGLDDGTKNSSAEGSGWDSHRTTRKTLRQTFGKDFTPRKSLRALVMEKSAKRQTAINEANTKLHQANSTELPGHNAPALDVEFDNEEIIKESDHEMSKRTRQTALEMYLEKVKKDITESKQKIEAEVRNSLKRNPVKINFPNRPPYKSIRKTDIKLMGPKALKTKRTKADIIPLELLPEDFINDLNYKPPKRYKPRNVSWITKRLYNFLETKLEFKYHYKARLRAEKLVETIYEFTRQVGKQRVASDHAISELKHEMARLGVVKTHYDFYDFFRDYMPFEIKIQVVPDIMNNLPLPKDVFSDIIA